MNNYRLDRWFSCLNGFTPVMFGALNSLLFGAEGCTLTYNGLLFIHCDLDRELSH